MFFPFRVEELRCPKVPQLESVQLQSALIRAAFKSGVDSNQLTDYERDARKIS